VKKEMKKNLLIIDLLYISLILGFTRITFSVYHNERKNIAFLGGSRMKKGLLLLLLLSPKINPETFRIPDHVKEVKIEINNNQYSSQTQSNANTNITTVTMRLKTTISNIVFMIQKNSDAYGKTLFSLIMKHKKRIILSSCVAFYLSLCAYLYYLQKYIQDTTAWHSWKSEFSFEELATLNLDSLSQALLITIQEKYFKHQDPKNNLLPLILFYNDIEAESRYINRYLMLCSIINRCFLSSFFPVSKKRIQHAMRKKHRLAFLKKLFISHMAAQNAATRIKEPANLLLRAFMTK
jgi:hypothetical protein